MAQAGFAFGEASGPDYFKVAGVASDDVLNIREKPSASADKIGEIPADGTGIRNLGCGGGLTFGEWRGATQAERTAAARSAGAEFRIVESRAGSPAGSLQKAARHKISASTREPRIQPTGVFRERLMC